MGSEVMPGAFGVTVGPFSAKAGSAQPWPAVPKALCQEEQAPRTLFLVTSSQSLCKPLLGPDLETKPNQEGFQVHGKKS